MEGSVPVFASIDPDYCLATGNAPVSPSNSSDGASASSVYVSSDSPTCQNLSGLSRKRKHASSKGQETKKKIQQGKKGINLKPKVKSEEEEQKKRELNRKYAHTSRLKKANELKQLKEDTLQQESIIEIYKKVMNIYHMRLYGTNITWSKCLKEWFPSQATRNSDPVLVECLLPDNDKNLLAELGNSAYGTLWTSGLPGVKQLTTSTADTNGTQAPITIASTFTESDGNELILQTDKNPVDCNLTTQSIPGKSGCYHPKPYIEHIITERAGATNCFNAQFNSQPVKVETLHFEQHPHASKTTENICVTQIREKDFLNHFSEVPVSQNQPHISGQDVKIWYVIANPKELKRTVEDPANTNSSSDKTEAALTGLNGGEQIRVFHRNPALNLKEEQSWNVSASLSAANTSAFHGSQNFLTGNQGGISHCIKLSQQIISKEENVSQPPLKGNSGKGSKILMSNVDKVHFKPNNNLSENKKLAALSNMPMNLTALKKEDHIIEKVDDSKVSKNYFLNARAGDVRLTCKPQVANISLNDEMQSGTFPTTSLCAFNENKQKLNTSTAPTPTLQFRNDKGEHTMQNKTHHSGKPLNQMIPPSHDLSSMLTETLDSQWASHYLTEHQMSGKSNIACVVMNPALKRPGLKLLPVQSHSEQGLVLPVNKKPETLLPCSVGIPSITTPVSPKSGTSQLPCVGQEPVKKCSTEQKAPSPPDESHIYFHTYSTSGLSSLSTFVIENDDVELENLKPTLNFPNQT
ncbi:hypothetical protein ElyMa_005012700 [Elysia marginata]|uniref:BZIP domain-containing protein n=1 Tax=Elysia marginata TaxID=1093978 RepID=A0AAV4J9J8_9GAST|nr:hypothetical protein ElyMa_005012700 [Elysia marginata]